MTAKTICIFGGSGAIGAATARAFARDGHRVCLGARGLERAERLAASIRADGGQACAFQVDVLDGPATASATARLARTTGGIDTVVNATSFLHDQGKELADLSLEEFQAGTTPYLVASFNIAQAVAPHMGGDRGGVIVTVTAPAAPLAVPGHLGHIVGCAGSEAFSRALASELGPRNIRVLCLRSHAIADAVEAGSFTAELFAPKARAMGLGVQDWLAGAPATTMLKRLPTLAQVAGTIAFLASDQAGAMTGSVVNLTAGFTTD
jgi:NAD(P)-dependent dehydrogenase (short-subunit alcohol dehydrogenase family)